MKSDSKRPQSRRFARTNRKYHKLDSRRMCGKCGSYQVEIAPVFPMLNERKICKNFTRVLSIFLAFAFGFIVGMSASYADSDAVDDLPTRKNLTQVSFVKETPRKFNPVVESDDEELRGIISDHIYWGSHVENAMPHGLGSWKNWSDYMLQSQIVRLELGCGRMQNRMVVFSDGKKACVRYRQNLDQIQGETFSYYLAQLLNLPNLPPSTVVLVNSTHELWKNVAEDIQAAQWHSNKPVVVTQYIPELESAMIPQEFRPNERHLNKIDVLDMAKEFSADSNKKLSRKLVELAQWTDLIIFDYLTANLDRFVNNLYNSQWNVNMMDAPAHNLAAESNSRLLVFLDNESGLLHGYRLLQKYEPLHRALLQGSCVFRKSTVAAVRSLYSSGSAGDSLNAEFARRADASLRDALPVLPARNARVLQERLGTLVQHFDACHRRFSTLKL